MASQIAFADLINERMCSRSVFDSIAMAWFGPTPQPLRFVAHDLSAGSLVVTYLSRRAALISVMGV